MLSQDLKLWLLLVLRQSPCRVQRHVLHCTEIYKFFSVDLSGMTAFCRSCWPQCKRWSIQLRFVCVELLLSIHYKARTEELVRTAGGALYLKMHLYKLNCWMLQNVLFLFFTAEFQ